MEYEHKLDKIFTAPKRSDSLDADWSAQKASGFPSPAQNHQSSSLSLDELVAPNASSTYYCRVAGDAMQAEGIFAGDLLVVDSSLTPVNGQLVVAVLFGELVIRRLQVNKQGQWLVAADSATYPPINLAAYTQDNVFWGVVTWVVHPT